MRILIREFFFNIPDRKHWSCDFMLYLLLYREAWKRYGRCFDCLGVGRGGGVEQNNKIPKNRKNFIVFYSSKTMTGDRLEKLTVFPS